VIPESWSLDFTLALTFIAMLVPSLTDRPLLAAALTAGIVAVVAYTVPMKLGLVVAALAGILVGLWLEMRK
jgi:predicted branched-subunit amino acid permease